MWPPDIRLASNYPPLLPSPLTSSFPSSPCLSVTASPPCSPPPPSGRPACVPSLRSRIRLLRWGRWPARRGKLVSHGKEKDTPPSHLGADADVMARRLRDSPQTSNVIMLQNLVGGWCKRRVYECVQNYSDTVVPLVCFLSTQWETSHLEQFIKNRLKMCFYLYSVFFLSSCPALQPVKILNNRNGSTGQGDLEWVHCNSRMVTAKIFHVTRPQCLSMFLFVGLVDWWRSGEAQLWPV